MVETAKILDNTPNRVVVQVPGRAYPGIVIQGDTLHSLKIMAESDDPLQKAQLTNLLDDLYKHYMAISRCCH